MPQLAKCGGREVRAGLWERRTSRRLGREERSGREAAERWLWAAEIFLRAGRVESEAGREVRALLETTAVKGGGVGNQRWGSRTGGGAKGLTDRVELDQALDVVKCGELVVCDDESLERV